MGMELEPLDSSPTWTPGLSTSLCLPRGTPLPQGIHLESTGLSSLTKLKKQIRLGTGLGPFPTGVIGDGGVDRCPCTFDFRTSWVGVLTACDGGGGFDSQQLGEVAHLVDFLSSYLSSMTLWFCDPWQVIEPP